MIVRTPAIHFHSNVTEEIYFFLAASQFFPCLYQGAMGHLLLATILFLDDALLKDRFGSFGHMLVHSLFWCDLACIPLALDSAILVNT